MRPQISAAALAGDRAGVGRRGRAPARRRRPARPGVPRRGAAGALAGGRFRRPARASLPALLGRHGDSDAWVDSAVNDAAPGASDPDLGAGLAAVLAAARTRRAAHDLAFGAALAAHTGSDTGVSGRRRASGTWKTCCPRWSCRWPATRPVLLLVLDGMSAGVGTEVVGQRAVPGRGRLGRGTAARADPPGRRPGRAAHAHRGQPGLAALRRAADRRPGRGAARLPGADPGARPGRARRCSTRSRWTPPGSGYAVADDVAAAIADVTGHPLVTCVLNTIDDALDRSDPGGTDVGRRRGQAPRAAAGPGPECRAGRRADRRPRAHRGTPPGHPALLPDDLQRPVPRGHRARRRRGGAGHRPPGAAARRPGRARRRRAPAVRAAEGRLPRRRRPGRGRGSGRRAGARRGPRRRATWPWRRRRSRPGGSTRPLAARPAGADRGPAAAAGPRGRARTRPGCADPRRTSRPPCSTSRTPVAGPRQPDCGSSGRTAARPASPVPAAVLKSAAYAAQKKIAGRVSVTDDQIRGLLDALLRAPGQPAGPGAGRHGPGGLAGHAARGRAARPAAAERGGLPGAAGRRGRRDGHPGRGAAAGAVRDPAVTEPRLAPAPPRGHRRAAPGHRPGQRAGPARGRAWNASPRRWTPTWTRSPAAARRSRRCAASTARARRSSPGTWPSGRCAAGSPPPRCRSPRPRRRCTSWRPSTGGSARRCGRRRSRPARCGRCWTPGCSPWSPTPPPPTPAWPDAGRPRWTRPWNGCWSSGWPRSPSAPPRSPRRCAPTGRRSTAGDAAAADALAAWLGGQPHVAAAAKRSAGIRGELDHFGAMGFLQGLLEVLRDAGHPGLLLVLDEVETLQRVRGDVRDKALNALRQLARRDRRRPVSGAVPGHHRDARVLRRPERRAAAAAAGAAAGHRLLHRPPVRQPAGRAAPAARLRPGRAADPRREGPRPVRGRGRRAGPDLLKTVDDGYVGELADAVTGSLGGKVGVAPRVFLKKLVADVLDRVDQFPDFDPRRHYALTLAAGELSETERNAAAGVRSPRPAPTTSTSTCRDRARSEAAGARVRAGPAAPGGRASHRQQPGLAVAAGAAGGGGRAGADGADALLLAPTAGGKTEAAVFPLLTAMEHAALVRPVGAVRLPAQGAAEQPAAPAGDLRRLAGPPGRDLARRRHRLGAAADPARSARRAADHAGVAGSDADQPQGRAPAAVRRPAGHRGRRGARVRRRRPGLAPARRAGAADPGHRAAHPADRPVGDRRQSGRHAALAAGIRPGGSVPESWSRRSRDRAARCLRPGPRPDARAERHARPGTSSWTTWGR